MLFIHENVNYSVSNLNRHYEFDLSGRDRVPDVQKLTSCLLVRTSLERRGHFDETPVHVFFLRGTSRPF